MGVSLSMGQVGPDAIKAFRFGQGMESRNTLATRTTPVLEPGIDNHFVRRLDSTVADGRFGIASLPITHPLVVAAKKSHGGGDRTSL